MTCKKCGGTMQAGKATVQTLVGGMPDFAGDTHPVTFSAGGPGKLIDCMKCVDCGWSVTKPQLKPCPCCDSTDLQFRMASGIDMGFVKCNACLISGSVAAWQNRPEVQVKPLVWECKPLYLTSGPFEIYVRDGDGKCSMSHLCVFMGGLHDDKRAAIAYAQAHHEKFILEALG